MQRCLPYMELHGMPGVDFFEALLIALREEKKIHETATTTADSLRTIVRQYQWKSSGQSSSSAGT